jgi:hypothetical protein
MYKHLVLWKTKADASEEDVQAMWNGLEELMAVPGVKNWSYGSNFHPKIKDYDGALSADFDTEEDLNAYNDHPLHVRVAEEKLFPFWEEFTVADYEFC